MKKTLVRNRSRLFLNVLALALALAVLALTPPPALSQQAPICETGCWNWNETHGCVQMMTCCVYPNGTYSCNQV